MRVTLTRSHGHHPYFPPYVQACPCENRGVLHSSVPNYAARGGLIAVIASRDGQHWQSHELNPAMIPQMDCPFAQFVLIPQSDTFVCRSDTNRPICCSGHWQTLCC